MTELRNYLNIVSQNKENKSYEFINEMLFETQNYKNMFNPIIKYLEKGEPHLIDSLKQYIKNEIKWAKSVLKRNDRIVWFLRYARIFVAYNHLPTNHLVMELFKKDFESIKNTHFGRLLIEDDFSAFSNEYSTVIKNTIKHYLSLPISKIHNYIFGSETYETIDNKFENFEREWAATLDAGRIPLSVDRDYEIIKKFPDNWYWIMLNRSECELESRAMGHCGNSSAPKNERILSLRKLIKENNQEFWEPHLTFIYDTDDGLLGEMKGKGNTKPAKKYHPYIVELLMMPFIKGIYGGGYLPENNFSMSDLAESIKRKLIEEKPSLATLMEIYKCNDNKINDYIKSKIISKLPNIKFLNNGTVVISAFPSVISMIARIGTNNVVSLVDRFMGAKKPDELMYKNYFDDDDIEKFLETVLSDEQLLSLKQYTWDIYKNYIEDFVPISDIGYDDIDYEWRSKNQYEIEELKKIEKSKTFKISNMSIDEMLYYWDRMIELPDRIVSVKDIAKHCMAYGFYKNKLKVITKIIKDNLTQIKARTSIFNSEHSIRIIPKYDSPFKLDNPISLCITEKDLMGCTETYNFKTTDIYNRIDFNEYLSLYIDYDYKKYRTFDMINKKESLKYFEKYFDHL